MSIKNSFKNFFYLEEYEEGQPQQQNQQASQHEKQSVTPEIRKSPKERRQKATEASTPNLVSLQTAASKSSKVHLAEPRVYAEAQDIAEHLKSKRAVVVNLQRIERSQGLRIIDFLSGTVYALGGDIQRIGTDIFLCVPDTVEVDGAISDFYYDEEQ
ncbi:cell division protein SepF [Planococcus sp. X10-3]|uniref:cell division protein SepF n=1 Tax=Planococcus sp. X10-3 TaxID=3061240 RepID=UPI003BAF905C